MRVWEALASSVPLPMVRVQSDDKLRTDRNKGALLELSNLHNNSNSQISLQSAAPYEGMNKGDTQERHVCNVHKNRRKHTEFQINVLRL